MKENKDRFHVELGLYRHFKGEYYCVTSVARHEGETYEDDWDVVYFNTCHPEYGTFTRPIDFWYFDVRDRKDNITGQTYRFQKVKDLNFQISSVPTEQLIEELRSREDSPIHELDIEGLESKVFAKDYIAGYVQSTEERMYVAQPYVVFEDEEKALNYTQTHSNGCRRPSVFKRILIEVKE